MTRPGRGMGQAGPAAARLHNEKFRLLTTPNDDPPEWTLN
jgi:hypothetical protein